MSALLAEPDTDLVVPAWLTVPEFDFTRGDEVIDLCEAVGWPCDPEQRFLLRAIFSGPPGVSFQTRDKQWNSFEDTVIAPRQQIKTSLWERATLGALWWLDAKLALWTAHVFNPAAADTFKTFREVIDGNASLSRRVRRISEGSGTQGIELTNGALLKFIARSKGGGRALSADIVVGDEWYAASEADEGALLPTMAATPNPKLWRASSAGRMESAPLRRVRDRGRSGGPGQIYAEWAITKRCVSERCSHQIGEPGCVLDMPDQWRRSCSAIVRGRVPESRIADYRRAMSPEEFGREFGGWWDEPRAGNVIPIPRWIDCQTDAGPVVEPVALFVDVALDRSQSVVAVCGANGDGLPQIELAAVRPGTDWVTDWVTERLGRLQVSAVGARSSGPVASLLSELREACDDAQVPFHKVGSGEFSGMCGGLFDAVMTGQLRHLGDELLTRALVGARKHQVLDAWQWERTRIDKDAEAAPLVAVTGAHALFLRTRGTDYDVLSSVY